MSGLASHLTLVGRHTTHRTDRRVAAATSGSTRREVAPVCSFPDGTDLCSRGLPGSLKPHQNGVIS